MRPVSFLTYLYMEKFWGKDRKKRPGTLYSKVMKTIVKEVGESQKEIKQSYLELITGLLNHPYAHAVQMNINGTKKTFAAAFMRQTGADRLAEIAASDRFNFLEMQYKRDRERPAPQAYLGFMEWQGKIIAVEARVHHTLQDAFPAYSRQEYVFNQALWVPKGYRDLNRDMLYDPDVFLNRVEIDTTNTGNESTGLDNRVQDAHL